MRGGERSEGGRNSGSVQGEAGSKEWADVIWYPSINFCNCGNGSSAQSMQDIERAVKKLKAIEVVYT